ncbi:MAG: hypothetical protein B7Z44_05390 [Caulobacter sp. 12-67-6]|nr:MAG: hypothetical protein B7Z44_05390 [Caulobacter sp. 12-67-6]
MSTSTIRPVIRPFMPAIILFMVLNAAFLIFSSRWKEAGFDTDVLIIGNLILFAVTFLTYWLGSKGLTTKNNHAFFRAVYGSFMIKLIVFAGAALVYITKFKAQLNKPALFFCMGLYLVYTFFEVAGLMKLSKLKKHG